MIAQHSEPGCPSVTQMPPTGAPVVESVTFPNAPTDDVGGEGGVFGGSVGVAVRVGDGDGVGDRLGVGDGVGAGVGWTVGGTVGSGVRGDGDGVRCTVGDGDGLGDGIGDGDGLGDGDGDGLKVGVADVAAGVAAMSVADGVGAIVNVGCPSAAPAPAP